MVDGPYRRAERLGGLEPTVFCPHCGARAKDEARRCDDCGGRIATVRCPSCFHVNHPDAALCTGCAAPLGSLEPVGAPDSRTCPGCSESLVRFDATSGALLDCDRCGGQFVETGLLREWLERRQPRASERPKRIRRENPLRERVTYRNCPSCGALMNRRNFGGSSGVIVDVCARDGVWFDTLELPRVLAFAEAGGLELARERERLERERTRRKAQANAPTVSFSPSPTVDLVDAGDLLDIVGRAIELVTRRFGK